MNVRAALSLVLLPALSLCGCVGGDDKADTGDTSTALVCGERSLDTCEADELCALMSAWPSIDDGAGGECVDYSASTPVGCVEAGQGCTAAEVLASHESAPDDCWVFGSGCLPDGWSVCSDGEYSECSE